jgi:acetyl esterase
MAGTTLTTPLPMARHLLTPRMATLLERIRRAPGLPFHAMTPAAARAAYRAAAEVLDLPRRPLPRAEDVTLPGGDGQPRPARLFAARAAGDGPPLPVLLYLHGGGFVIGGPDTHEALCRQLAARSGCAVVSLDYRLAPEHPFPAAVEDTLAALRALPGWAARHGLDGGRLAIGGDSAGATLATVGALLARDGGPSPALQLLITPGTSSHADWPSRRQFAEGFLLDETTIEWFFGQVLPAAQRHDWRFAPLEADDLEGSAPAHVVLAECDPLVDEGLAYADRLRLAGVPVSLDLVRGVTHDFIKMGRALPEAAAALDGCAAALREALQPGIVHGTG